MSYGKREERVKKKKTQPCDEKESMTHVQELEIHSSRWWPRPLLIGMECDEQVPRVGVSSTASVDDGFVDICHVRKALLLFWCKTQQPAVHSRPTKLLHGGVHNGIHNGIHDGIHGGIHNESLYAPHDEETVFSLYHVGQKVPSCFALVLESLLQEC